MLSRSQLLALPFLVLPLVAQQPAAPAAADPNAVDEAANAFFLDEGMQRSQVMEHLSWLCDVHGPRVTGSPNLRKAQAWAVQRLHEFGLAARTEKWGPRANRGPGARGAGNAGAGGGR